MEKLKAILDLFRKGSSVSEPAKWKERQITATVLAGVILALVHLLSVFGVAIPLDMDTANAIAGGIIAIVNVVLTVTTTDKIGLPAKPEDVTVVTPVVDQEVQPEIKPVDTTKTPIDQSKLPTIDEPPIC